MGSSLGSVFVDLKINTAAYIDGLSKAGITTGKTGRDMKTAFGKIGEALAPLGGVVGRLAGIFDQMGNAVNAAGQNVKKFGLATGSLMAGAGVLAALSGAAFALANHAAEVGSKIYEASQKTGIAAAQMSGLMAVVKETGGDFDSLTTSLARAGANLEKAILDPSGKASAVFAQLMGSAKNLADLGLQPMGDRLQTILSRIFSLSDAGQRNIALSQLLGRGWMQNVDTLKLLAERGYAPAIEQAKKFGMFFDTQSAANAKQFKIAVADLRAELSGMGVTLGTKLIPAITNFLTTMNSLGGRWVAYGHAIAAFHLALTGVGLPLAIEQWKQYKQAIKDADQSDTNFLVHLQDLTRGEKAASEETANLAGASDKHKKAIKEKRDVLADLIARQKDELTELNLSGNAQRSIRGEYDRTVREIEKAVKAGGDYKESLIALDLALDVYIKKLAEANDQKLKPPTLELPKGGVPGLLPEVMKPSLQLKLAEIARLATMPEETTLFSRTLADMANLSAASFQKLAAVFPNLTEGEVAAGAAGQRLVAQLAKVDKLDLRGFAALYDADRNLIQQWDTAALRIGTLQEKFRAFGNEVALMGADLGEKVFGSMLRAMDDLSTQLAQFVVTGKANFKSLFQSLAMDIAKAQFQSLIGGIARKIGSVFNIDLGRIAGLGGKPSGTRNDPIFTRSADGLGKALGKGLDVINAGGEGLGSLEQMQRDLGLQQAKIWKEITAVFKSIGSAMSSVLKAIGSIAGSIFSFLGGLFGGMREFGGAVEPGKAYIVGERHPELFMPRQSGQIVPTLPSGQRPVVNNFTWNITTPDADGFRRSMTQIQADIYRSSRIAYARS